MADFTNVFDDVPAVLTEELVQTLLSRSDLRIERIVSMGHASPDGYWYDQNENEWVLLLAGAARLSFENGEPIDLTPGAFVDIPAHLKHRVEWTEPDRPTIWLAIHYGDRA